MKSKVCFRSFKVVSSQFDYDFRCIYFLVFETAFYVAFFFYTAYSSLIRIASFSTLLTSHGFASMNFLYIPIVVSICNEKFKARQEFSVLTWDDKTIML